MLTRGLDIICVCSLSFSSVPIAAYDPQNEARRDTRRYDQRLVSAGSSEPVLVRSLATTLSSIKDVDYLVPDFLDSTTAEHSMHTAKAGDLSSTAIIPYQLKGIPLESAAPPRRSHSLDGIAEESHYLEKISSTNKLALILNNTDDSTGIHEEELIEAGQVYHNPAYEQGSHSNITTTPSPSEQGGLTPSDMGSTDFLVQRSPIMSHSNRVSNRERTNTSPHQFEVPSLCTVVALCKTSEVKDGVKLTPNNTKEGAGSQTEGAGSQTEGAGSQTEGAGSQTEEATSAAQVTSQTVEVMSQKENITSSEGIRLPAECSSISLPIEDTVPDYISSVAPSPTDPTSPRIQNTILILQHANTTVSQPATGRRESATREFGSKTVQDLKRQYEAAKKAPSVLEDNLPSPNDMVHPSVSKNRGNLWNSDREHHSA